MFEKTFGYSDKNAYYCALLSRLVYSRKPEDVSKIARELGMTLYRSFDSNATQAVLFSNNEFIVVAFRGTEIEEWEDIRTDAKVRKTGGPLAGKVHRGFLGALLEIWTEYKIDGKMFHGLEAEINSIRNETALLNNGVKPSIIFTGHSLGAALATLATAFMIEESIPVLALYTFGSPRVGCPIFASSFDGLFKRHWRNVNHMDIVPRLPPRSFGYKHCGDFTYWDRSGDLNHDPSRWELLLDIALDSIHDLTSPELDSVVDHRSTEYERVAKRQYLKVINRV